MIFLPIGLVVFAVGLVFFLFPGKKEILIYGYRTRLAKQSDAHWKYAQKTSGIIFLLFGGVMAAIGAFLEYTGNTNFFLVEILAIPWFIAPMFGLIETKLQKFDQNYRGERNEYFDD